MTVERLDDQQSEAFGEFQKLCDDLESLFKKAGRLQKSGKPPSGKTIFCGAVRKELADTLDRLVNNQDNNGHHVLHATPVDGENPGEFQLRSNTAITRASCSVHLFEGAGAFEPAIVQCTAALASAIPSVYVWQNRDSLEPNAAQFLEKISVIDSFRDEFRGRTFLMPPKGEGSLSDPIDISQECLLRQWTKLREWVKDEARDAAQFQRPADRADGGAGEPLRGRDLDAYWDWWQRAKPTPQWARRYETPADAGLNTPPRTYQAARDYLFASRNSRLGRNGVIAALLALLAGAGFWQPGQTLASKDKAISQKDAALSSQNAALSHLSINLTQVAEGSTRNNSEKEALAAIARYAQNGSVQTRAVDSGLPAAAGTTPRIYPQYWTDDQKNSLQQIAVKLSESGFIMAPAQKVSVGPSDTELRYFHQEQAGEAGKIVEALKSSRVNAKSVYIAGFDKVAINQFEPWFPRPADQTR